MINSSRKFFPRKVFSAKFVPKIAKRESFRQIFRVSLTRESFCPRKYSFFYNTNDNSDTPKFKTSSFLFKRNFSHFLYYLLQLFFLTQPICFFCNINILKFKEKHKTKTRDGSRGTSNNCVGE